MKILALISTDVDNAGPRLGRFLRLCVATLESDTAGNLLRDIKWCWIMSGWMGQAIRRVYAWQADKFWRQINSAVAFSCLSTASSQEAVLKMVDLLDARDTINAIDSTWR